MQQLSLIVVDTRLFLKYFLAFLLLTVTNLSAQTNELMIRIAELEIDSSYLAEYNNILKEESRVSLQLEPGVIAIFPVYQKQDPTQIRILEVYANREAYESHLKTPHFLKYKSSTLKMVKSLKLVEMNSIDPEGMKEIFHKLNQNTDAQK
jgi:quinol monooxygenase YgiN